MNRDPAVRNTLILICVLLLVLSLAGTSSARLMASISGKVTAEDTGEGLSEILVRAMPGNFRTVTNEKGNYILKGLVPGLTYQLSFFREGSLYVNEFWSTDVHIPKGKYYAIVDRALELGAAVSGSVYDAKTKVPLSGAAVAATSLNQPGWAEHFKTTRTDDNGKFLILGLPESERCRVDVAVYGHAWISKFTSLKKGETTGDVIFFVEWDDLTGIGGRVLSAADNKPIISARVIIRNSVTMSTIGITFTDIEGEYSIIGVPPGVYEAAVTRRKEEMVTENVNVSLGKTTEVNFLVESAEPKATDEREPGTTGIAPP
jgi:hypothetical protein